MRRTLAASAALALAVALAPLPVAAIKMTRYPEVKVELAEPYKPDAAFEAMRKALADAIARKDAPALFGLVGPTFVWTVESESTAEFDMGRDALHNFKVAFGFRAFGQDADGPVEGGPFWDALSEIVKDAGVTRPDENANLVCGPIAASVVSDAALQQARKRLETADDVADWYHTLAETPVAKAPGDTGAPMGKLGRSAFPVIDVHPPAPEGQPAPPITHLQVLLPTGKTGWIPYAAARPLVRDRLCYAKTAAGDWKIASYDQNQ